jgi:hypothetical protein
MASDASDRLSPSEQSAVTTCSFAIRPSLFKVRLTRDGKRRSIAREIIETERNYVESLLITEEVYYKPLDRSISSKNPLIDTATLSQLFGCLDQIRATHQIILRVMDEVLASLKSPLPDPAEYSRVANTITELVPRMAQLYISYLATNDQSEEILKRLKKNRKFKSFLSESLFNPRAKCQEIDDLLILPTQRIAGYKLLFERLIKYFPPETFGQQRDEFTRTLDSLLKIGASMNAEKSEGPGQEKLLTIAETVTNLPGSLCILKPGRKYIADLEVRAFDEAAGKELKAHELFLLSDLLLICRKQEGGLSSGKLTYVNLIPLRQVQFEAAKKADFAEKVFIIKSDTETFPFWCKDPAKRDEFVEATKSTKKAIREQVKRQTEEGADFIQGLLGQLTQTYTTIPAPRGRLESLDALK